MDAKLQNINTYEAPEMEVVNVTVEDCILNVSNYDGAETD